MSTLPSNLTLDNFQPKLETKDTPESHLLLIHLPGFAQQQVGAKFEFDHRRVRIFGVRPFQDDKLIRFNIAYSVPWNCDMGKLKDKFEGGIYSVIMPKNKSISGEEASKSPLCITEFKSKSTTLVEQEKTTIVDQVKGEKGKMGISQGTEKSTSETPKQVVKETLNTPKASNYSVPQKGEEGIIPQKMALSRDTKHKTEEKISGTIVENSEKVTKESDIVKKSCIPKTKENEKGQGKENEMNGVFSDETREGIYDMTKSKGKRIKEVAASVTSMLKRFNEDNEMVICTSATVLAVALLGAYASYKFGSSTRS